MLGTVSLIAQIQALEEILDLPQGRFRPLTGHWDAHEDAGRLREGLLSAIDTLRRCQQRGEL